MLEGGLTEENACLFGFAGSDHKWNNLDITKIKGTQTSDVVLRQCSSENCIFILKRS